MDSRQKEIQQLQGELEDIKIKKQAQEWARREVEAQNRLAYLTAMYFVCVESPASVKVYGVSPAIHTRAGGGLSLGIEQMLEDDPESKRVAAHYSFWTGHATVFVNIGESVTFYAQDESFADGYKKTTWRIQAFKTESEALAAKEAREREQRG